MAENEIVNTEETTNEVNLVISPEQAGLLKSYISILGLSSNTQSLGNLYQALASDPKVPNYDNIEFNVLVTNPVVIMNIKPSQKSD